MITNEPLAGQNGFSQKYPIPEDYDSDVRQSYKGGFTYLNPKYKEKEVGEGIVLDVNSLYPDVMYHCPLPFGEGIAFHGKYEHDKDYPLYVQMFRTPFKVKEGMLPTVQLKGNGLYVSNEYVTETKPGDEPVIVLTNVDLKLFREHYDFPEELVEYMGGWKFQAYTGLFKAYIDKWMAVKEEATRTGNKAMRQLAKLMLNALYGKFGTGTTADYKKPQYIDGVVNLSQREEDEKNPIYVPMASFITAWARYKTINAAQNCYERFIYADTDSLHLEGTEVPDGMDIDPVRLGAWDHEATFNRAKFLRQKCYIESIVKDGKEDIKVTCAGMPKSCHKYVTFENFKIGAQYEGKLQPSHVHGGVVLKPVDFTIKP